MGLAECEFPDKQAGRNELNGSEWRLLSVSIHSECRQTRYVHGNCTRVEPSSKP